MSDRLSRPVTKSSTSPQMSTKTNASFVRGVVAGMVSAAGYTAANICLRRVAIENDPVFVSFVKAIPLVLVTGTTLVWQIRYGLHPLLRMHWIIRLVLAGVFMQLTGNVAFQWSLGQIGLALSVPLSMGMLLIGSAVLARIWLAEPIRPSSALAILLLVLSIAILSAVADQSVAAIHHLDIGQISRWQLGFGLGAACLSGFSYSVCNVVIRRALSEGTSLIATLLTVSLTGVVVLGTWTCWHTQPSRTILEVDNLWVMILAGVFNAIAFYALGKSLQHLTVIHANLLTASQVMLCALCGIFLFGEPAGTLQMTGIALTMVALLLTPRPTKQQSD